MSINQNILVHNLFELEVSDRDGHVKQKGIAYNTILDKMFERLTNFQTFFVGIAFGSGTGVTVPNRTELFNRLGYKPAETVEVKKDVEAGEYYWKRKITLDYTEFNDITISEVGVAYSSAVDTLVTHALIADLNGNPIIINKTAGDVVTIYATIFFRLGDYNGKFKFTNLPENALINYFTSNIAPSNITVQVGGGRAGVESRGNSCTWMYAEKPITWIADTANRRVYTSPVSLTNSEANANIWEIGLKGIARALMPIQGIYEGTQFNDVVVGIGDGVKQEFLIPHSQINDDIELMVDGVITQEFVKEDYMDKIGFSLPINDTTNPELTVTNINNIAFSPDGRYIAMAQIASPFLSVYEFDRVNNKLGRRIDNPSIPVDFKAESVAWSHDGNYIAVGIYLGGNRQLYVYKFDKNAGVIGELLPNPIGLSTNVVYSIAFSPDDRYLAFTQGSAINIHRFDSENGIIGEKIISPVTGLFATVCYHIEFSEDGKYIACAFPGSTPFLVFPFNSSLGTIGEKLSLPSNPGSSGYVVRFTSDNRYIVVGFRSAPYLSIFPFSTTANQIGEALPITHNIASSVNDLSITNDGKNIVVGYSNTPYVSVYNFSNATLTPYTFPESFNTKVLSTAWSPSDDYMVLGLESAMGIYSKLRIYSTEKNRTKIALPFPPALNQAITANYSVDYIPKTKDKVINDLQFIIQFGTFV